MNRAHFGSCLAQTLLPGGPLSNGVDAPDPGSILSAAELAIWLAIEAVGPAVQAIGKEAGGPDAFIAAAPDRREEILRAVERTHPAPFHSLVTALLTLYYEHPAVAQAFGWRSAPPQPGGHRLAGMDESLFEAVNARGPAWRKAE